MSVLEKLDLAIEHLEAAAEGDKGRAGLGYIAVREARDELLAMLTRLGDVPERPLRNSAVQFQARTPLGAWALPRTTSE